MMTMVITIKANDPTTVPAINVIGMAETEALMEGAIKKGVVNSSFASAEIIKLS